MNRELTPDSDVLIRLPAWLAAADELPTRELRGTVVRVTQKAVLARVSPSTREAPACLACGRLPGGPTKAWTDGYCAEHGGDAVVARFNGATRTIWLPLRAVEITDPHDRDPAWDAEADRPRTVGATVAVDGDRITARIAYDQRHLAKQVPGYTWRKAQKVWSWPASPAVAARLAESLADVGYRGDEAFETLLGTYAQRLESSSRKSAEELPDVPNAKTRAWLHQRQAFWFAEKLDASALFMSMGTGKSKVLIDLIVHRGHMISLIVGRKNACRVWPREFRRHAPADIRVIQLAGKQPGLPSLKAKATQAEAEIRYATGQGVPIVLIINYESVWREVFAELVMGRRWDLIALDESHAIKGAGTKVSTFMGRAARVADHRVVLTGTPMPHSPLDIYGQYRFLDPGIFGTSYNRFKRRYAVVEREHHSKEDTHDKVTAYTMMAERFDSAAGHMVPNEHYNPRHEQEWNDRVWGIAYAVGKEVLDLPPVRDLVVSYELDDKLRGFYRDLDADLYAYMRETGWQVTAANTITKLLRLAQLCGGHLVDDDEGIRQVGSAKQEAFAEKLDGLPLDEPVIVFCRFTADLDRVREVVEASGRAYGELSGRRNDALGEDEPTMNPDVDVAGVQIQSGGVGIDLTRAAHAFYYSVGYDLGAYDQSRSRLDRPGQTRPVTFWHLVGEHTTEVDIYTALTTRQAVVSYVLERMRARHERGEEYRAIEDLDDPDDEEEPDDEES